MWNMLRSLLRGFHFETLLNEKFDIRYYCFAYALNSKAYMDFRRKNNWYYSRCEVHWKILSDITEEDEDLIEFQVNNNQTIHKVGESNQSEY